MIWIVIVGLAGAAFCAAAFALRLPRAGWTLFAAALVFGMAGYAAQGSPETPAAPALAVADPQGTGELLVEARRSFYGADRLPSRYVVTADAFARRGHWHDAASFLRNALNENPNDSEAWLALAISLVEVAEGQMTPAAQMAFARADARQDSVAPGFFYGLTLLRGGDPLAAREVWADFLARAKPDAKGRDLLAARLALLDRQIAGMRTQATD